MAGIGHSDPMSPSQIESYHEKAWSEILHVNYIYPIFSSLFSPTI